MARASWRAVSRHCSANARSRLKGAGLALNQVLDGLRHVPAFAASSGKATPHQATFSDVIPDMA